MSVIGMRKKTRPKLISKSKRGERETASGEGGTVSLLILRPWQSYLVDLSTRETLRRHGRCLWCIHRRALFSRPLNNQFPPS